jgi:hypothetical protein
MFSATGGSGFGVSKFRARVDKATVKVHRYQDRRSLVVDRGRIALAQVASNLEPAKNKRVYIGKGPIGTWHNRAVQFPPASGGRQRRSMDFCCIVERP